MNNVLSFCFLIIVLLSSCGKDTDCNSDQIFFGSTCIDRQGFTFYKAVVGDFCMPDSVMIGLDYTDRLVGKWVYATKSSSGNWNVGSGGFVSFDANDQDFGYAVTCNDQGSVSTSFTIDDLQNLNESAETIDVHLLHHPNGLNHIDPEESGEGSKTVQFFRQN